ncbi:MAG TPA: tripartite tricarboxylate transporter substrate-binding protein [Burkholderiales bacterium]|nr:tripartite tricarboxylate transporter substrate-binding protein [Burkholderiales bacterium]
MIRFLLLLSFALPAWAQTQYVLVVPASSKISGITELIAEATARPGELSYGSNGIRGGSYIAGDLLARMTKTQLTHVPYKTRAAALADLLDGKVSFMFDTVASSAPLVNGGKLRAFAVIGSGHARALPKVPTMAEAGFGGFDEEFARLARQARSKAK